MSLESARGSSALPQPLRHQQHISNHRTLSEAVYFRTHLPHRILVPLSDRGWPNPCINTAEYLGPVPGTLSRGRIAPLREHMGSTKRWKPVSTSRGSTWGAHRDRAGQCWPSWGLHSPSQSPGHRRGQRGRRGHSYGVQRHHGRRGGTCGYSSDTGTADTGQGTGQGASQGGNSGLLPVCIPYAHPDSTHSLAGDRAGQLESAHVRICMCVAHAAMQGTTYADLCTLHVCMVLHVWGSWCHMHVCI